MLIVEDERQWRSTESLLADGRTCVLWRGT